MTLESDPNLKKNRLVVWIITWEIWQIFTTALESWDSKWELLRATFIPSRKCMSLKLTGNYVMMFQWRKAQNLKRNCLVQNWHQECSKCWPEHSKISKNCTLMGCFWPHYTMLQLRECRGILFDGTQDW